MDFRAGKSKIFRYICFEHILKFVSTFGFEKYLFCRIAKIPKKSNLEPIDLKDHLRFPRIIQFYQFFRLIWSFLEKKVWFGKRFDFSRPITTTSHIQVFYPTCKSEIIIFKSKIFDFFNNLTVPKNNLYDYFYDNSAMRF